MRGLKLIVGLACLAAIAVFVLFANTWITTTNAIVAWAELMWKDLKDLYKDCVAITKSLWTPKA